MASSRNDSPGTQLGAHRHGVTLWLTLEGEAVRNAVDRRVYESLISHLDQAENDTTLRTIALTGAGSAFCAGMNFKAIQDNRSPDDESVARDVLLAATAMHRLRSVNKPTVAVVNGSAMGAGLGLVVSCDLAIAVEAARFAVPEVRAGLVPGLVAPLLVDAIGVREAKRRLMVADPFDAHEAHRIGIVHEIVNDPDSLAAAADRYIAEIGAGGPTALIATKQTLLTSPASALDPDLLPEIADGVAKARHTTEAEEGLRAMQERRRPKWAT